MKRYHSLNIYFKIVVWSVVLMIITTLVSVYFFTVNQYEVPLGIIIGLGLGAFLYAMTGLIVLKDKDSNWLLASNFIRLLVLGGAIFGVGFLYYKMNIHAINLFALVGGYTAVIIIFVILTLIENKKESNK